MERSRLAWQVLGVAVALASLTESASAAAPSPQWKFNEGDTLHYRMDQKTLTESKAKTQDVKTTVTQTIDTTWTVGAVEKETGTASMTQSIDRVRTKIEFAFGSFEYDSNSDKAPEGPIAASVVPILKALVGARFQYKISPQGELSDVQVPDSLIKALKEAGPAGGNVGMFSEDGLKNMINESSLVIPKEARSNPTWTRQTKIPSPPIGTLILDKTYKYEGADAKGDDKIALDVKISLESVADANFDAKITHQEGRGEFQFDPKAGRVTNSRVSQKVEMLIKVMNNEVIVSSDMSTTMTLVDQKAGGSK